MTRDRELDLRQITIETQARTNALNFAIALEGRSHGAGNVDKTLRMADRLTRWIMTGTDPDALAQLPGSKPPVEGGGQGDLMDPAKGGAA